MKKGKVSKPAAKVEMSVNPVPAKSAGECCSGTPECCSATESNFRKLVRSGMLVDFVKTKNGHWNHQEWLELCGDITSKGYAPIDFDQVGLVLELEKGRYSSQKEV